MCTSSHTSPLRLCVDRVTERNSAPRGVYCAQKIAHTQKTPRAPPNTVEQVSNLGADTLCTQTGT